MSFFKDKIKECYLCGEMGILKEYRFSLFNYGKICKKCIDYMEIENAPKRIQEENKLRNERLERQKKWREIRDKKLK